MRGKIHRAGRLSRRLLTSVHGPPPRLNARLAWRFRETPNLQLARAEANAIQAGARSDEDLA